jgi:hypothetical protein
MIKTQQDFTFIERRRLDIVCWLLGLIERIDPTVNRKVGA